jgi:L-lactate dehydrogenase
MRRPKIVIVGAGLVGGSAALFSAVAIPSAQIVIVDIERVRAEAQALDLAHATAFWGHDRVRAGEYDDVQGADIVVVTAGVGVKPGQTRLDLVRTNARIVGDIVDRTASLAPRAVHVVATNPCDVLAAVARDRLACAREQVISTGTSLDTARLRALLSERLGVVAPAIDAYVLGEHGESALVHWSGASVGGMPLELFLTRAGKELGMASRGLILRSVHDAAKQIKEGKGATHYGIASAVARICQAIVHDSNRRSVGRHRAPGGRRRARGVRVLADADQRRRRAPAGLSRTRPIRARSAAAQRAHGQGCDRQHRRGRLEEGTA